MGGTVSFWWAEDDLGSPIPGIMGLDGQRISISCEDPEAITSDQCKGSCYYQGYTHAKLHHDDDPFFTGECYCGRDCVFEEMRGARSTYTVWKWHEGFFYDASMNEVWILASTHTDDLNIFMWVGYTDNVGNEAWGQVEFWIAPSLEAAAAQGRTCDEADRDPQAYILPFAFSSDDRISTEHVLGSTFIEDVDDLTREVIAHVFHHGEIIWMDGEPVVIGQGNSVLSRNGITHEDLPRTREEADIRMSRDASQSETAWNGWTDYLVDRMVPQLRDAGYEYN